MGSIRCTTAGESHGPAEVCIVEGVPAGLPLCAEHIDRELGRRQHGYGRGGRMAIEKDRARILSGVRGGCTLGTPIAILVENVDHKNWIPAMQTEPWPEDQPEAAGPPVTIPRPGHADLAGLCKYDHHDIRNVLERASARETVGRVAGGAVARALLERFGVRVGGRVLSIGAVRDHTPIEPTQPDQADWEAIEASELFVAGKAAELSMIEAIDTARVAGESLGGTFEIYAWGLVPGLGGFAARSSRLDGQLFGAVAGIPAIVGVELGLGFRRSELPGSQAHDSFSLDESGTTRFVSRPTNRAGGLEGGMTNGLPLVLRGAMKPIPTMTTPLPSVDLARMVAAPAHKERSDVVAVPAALVVAEAEVCIVLASAYLEKFGGDCLADTVGSIERYSRRLEERGLWLQSPSS